METKEQKQQKKKMAVGFLLVFMAGGFLGYIVAPREVIHIERPVEVAPELLPENEILEEIRETTDGLTTLVYGAIGASLIAALAAIVSLMQISRRIP